MRIALLFLLVPAFVVAQGPPLRVRAELITVDDGLPQGLVWSIVQDRQGFLWFGTKDGLDRFDGYEHVVYRHDAADTNSLCESHVTSLFEDTQGRIWIGTDSKGVDIYDPSTGRFTHVRQDRRGNAPFPTVVNIQEHPNGDIWVHGFFATVHIIKASDRAGGLPPIMRPLDEVYPGVDVLGLRDIEILPNGDIWLLRKRSMGVYHLGLDRVEHVQEFPIAWPVDDGAYFPELIAHPEVPRVLLIWDQNLVRFRSDTRTIQDTLVLANVQKRESRLYLDGDDRLWGLTGTGSWFRMEMATGMLTHLQPELDTGRPLDLAWFGSWAMDRTGILWCGTTGHGVVKYDPRSERFRTWTEEADGLWCTELVRTDLEGSVLLNGEEFKELVATGTSPRSIGLAEALERYGLMADWRRCVRDPRGGYWFSGVVRGSDTRHLYRFDPRDGSIAAMTHDPKEHFLNVFPGRGDTIWVSGGPARTDEDSTLTAFDTRTARIVGEYRYPGRVKNSMRRGIAAWAVAGDGTIWMGCDLGVYALRPASGTWRTFSPDAENPHSLPSEAVFSLCFDPIDPLGHIWVGTEGAGMVRMNMRTGRCDRSVTTAEGLPNNVVYGILPDDKGNLWLSTNQGLSRYDPGSGHVRTFTKADGIAGNEFNRYSAERAVDGTMFFGGMEGITWFDPEMFQSEEAHTPTRLTGLRLLNKPVTAIDQAAVLPVSITHLRELVLPYDERMVTFEFANMDLAAPERNMFRYRLDDFHKDWIPNGTGREATFTNLDPGTYTFRVQGRNSAGVWDPMGASLTVVITPPWWGTWWFRSLLVMGLAGLLYAFYRYRLARALEVVRVRDRIARDLHDEIGSTLSSVALYSTVARTRAGDRLPEASAMLDRITESTTEVMEAMNDIVWAVNTKNDDMAHVVQRMRAFGVAITEAASIRLQLDVEPDVEDLALDMTQRRDLYLIFKEAVNNAVKYGQADTVRVALSRAGGRVELVVRDDGMGFDTGEATSRNGAGGNGLPNMQRRARDMGGQLTIRSAPGEGTSIVLRFDPKQRNSLDPMTDNGDLSK